MGLGGISIWQLLIILVIVVLVFGTKRIKSLGGDLGSALKSFRKAMDQDEDKDKDKSAAAKEGERKQLESDREADAEFAEQKDTERRG